MRTGNPPDELEVLLIFRVLRAGYRVVLLRLVQASLDLRSFDLQGDKR